MLFVAALGQYVLAQNESGAPLEESNSQNSVEVEPGAISQAIPFLAVGFPRDEGAEPSRLIEYGGIKLVLLAADENALLSELSTSTHYAGIVVSGGAWTSASRTLRLEIIAAAAKGMNVYVCAPMDEAFKLHSNVVFDAGGNIENAAKFFAERAAILIGRLDYVPENIDKFVTGQRRAGRFHFFDIKAPIRPAAYKLASADALAKRLRGETELPYDKFIFASEIFARPELYTRTSHPKRSLEDAWFAEPLKESVAAQKAQFKQKDIWRITLTVFAVVLICCLVAVFRRTRIYAAVAYVVILFSFALVSWNPPGMEFSLKRIRQDDALRMVVEEQAIYRVNSGVRTQSSAGGARFESFEAGSTPFGGGGIYLRTERRTGRQIHRNLYPSTLVSKIEDDGTVTVTMSNLGRQAFEDAFVGYGYFAAGLGSVDARHTVSVRFPPAPPGAAYSGTTIEQEIALRIDELLLNLYLRRAGPLAKSLESIGFGLRVAPVYSSEISQVLGPYGESGALFEQFPENTPWMLAVIRDPASEYESVTIIEQTGLAN